MPLPPHVPPLGALETGEFARHDEASRTAEHHLGPNGRCYGSMSGYRARTPVHLTVKNANVCTRTLGKIWWGDLDITETVSELRALASDLGEAVYVLPEMAARWQMAEMPDFGQASYATDWHDDAVIPTRAWAAGAIDRFRMHERQRPRPC